LFHFGLGEDDDYVSPDDADSLFHSTPDHDIDYSSVNELDDVDDTDPNSDLDCNEPSASQLSESIPDFPTAGADGELYTRTSSNHDQFMEWFKEQQWFCAGNRDIEAIGKSFAASTKSSHWEHFVQGARKDTGTPQVACIRCGKILKHPSIPVSNGTSSLGRHLDSKECQNASTHRQDNRQHRTSTSGATTSNGNARVFYRKVRTHIV
jgi:hypothetical protein